MHSTMMSRAVLFGVISSTTLALPRPDQVPLSLKRDGDCGPNAMTINIENKLDADMSLKWQNGGDGGYTCGATPDGGPGYSILAAGQTTTATVTEGWNGAVFVKDHRYGPATGVDETKIEATWKNGIINYDVGMVDGFSVPIVCSAPGTGFSGCNLNLFDSANPAGACPVSSSPLGTCHNPAQTEQTPENPNDTGEPTQSQKLFAAGVIPDSSPQEDVTSTWYRNLSPWFAPCEGAAYIGQYDDIQAGKGTPSGSTTVLNCCIGDACPTPSNQPGWDWRMGTADWSGKDIQFKWSNDIAFQ